MSLFGVSEETSDTVASGWGRVLSEFVRPGSDREDGCRSCRHYRGSRVWTDGKEYEGGDLWTVHIVGSEQCVNFVLPPSRRFGSEIGYGPTEFTRTYDSVNCQSPYYSLPS